MVGAVEQERCFTDSGAEVAYDKRIVIEGGMVQHVVFSNSLELFTISLYMITYRR